jgi:high-affinity nickel permease
MTITDQKPNVRVGTSCVVVISCLMQSYHFLKTENLTRFFFESTEHIQTKVTAVLEAILPLSANIIEVLEYLIKYQFSQNQPPLFF